MRKLYVACIKRRGRSSVFPVESHAKRKGKSWPNDKKEENFWPGNTWRTPVRFSPAQGNRFSSLMTLITSTLITLGGKLRNDLELELEAVETKRDVFVSIKGRLTVDFCRSIYSVLNSSYDAYQFFSPVGSIRCFNVTCETPCLVSSENRDVHFSWKRDDYVTASLWALISFNKYIDALTTAVCHFRTSCYS